MIVVKYREARLAPLLFFLLFLLVCLIALPLWYFTHYGTPQGYGAGKVILAPLAGLFWLVMAIRTFQFNARVREEPRALEWNAQRLSLWQSDRAETVPWQQVGQISIKQGRRTSDLSFLKIVTSRPGEPARFWSFPSARLQLAGLSLAEIAKLLEQARKGNAGLSPSMPVDRQQTTAKREERIAKVRGIFAVIVALYFVTGAGMAVYLISPHTILLTPFDPLLWTAAKIGFFGVSIPWLLSYVKTIRQLRIRSWRVIAWFFPKVMFTGLMCGAMMGGWCYLAANVYVTAKTFGGGVHHGTVLMIARPSVSLHGHPTVEARLMNRPGRVVTFTIDEADKKATDQWYRPGVPEDTPCVTVPVQWAGRAIRAEVTTDDPLPAGSVSGCF